jgi:hypothetical protein
LAVHVQGVNRRTVILFNRADQIADVVIDRQVAGPVLGVAAGDGEGAAERVVGIATVGDAVGAVVGPVNVAGRGVVLARTIGLGAVGGQGGAVGVLVELVGADGAAGVADVEGLEETSGLVVGLVLLGEGGAVAGALSVDRVDGPFLQ